MRIVHACLVFALCCLAASAVGGCEDLNEGMTTAPPETTTSSQPTTTTIQTTTTSPATTTSVTEPPASAEEAALEDAIELELEYRFDISIEDYMIVEPWAGVWIPAPDASTDPCPFLLKREGAGWRVVEYSTGYQPEDWIAAGAPRELADWF